MDEEFTTPQNLDKQAGSSIGSNAPTASTKDESSITLEKLGELHLGDTEDDEEPTTPKTPPRTLSSRQGPELLSATKNSDFKTKVLALQESDLSENYILAEDEISCCSSLLTNSSTDIEEAIHKGKVIRRRIGCGQAPRVDERIDQAKVRELKKERGVKDDNDIVKSLEKYKNQYRQTKRTYTLDQLNRSGDQREEEIGKCFTLEEEQDIVYVEELQCHLLKGRSTYSCKYDDKRTMKLFAKIDLLLALIYRLLVTDTTVNIRMIPYAYKDMFPDIRAVQNVLERICKAIGCTRDSLNIYASAKGRIAGDVKFSYTTEGTTYETCCEGGANIEPRDVAKKLNFDKLTKQEFLLITVVEKETIFQRLLEENFHKRFRCLVITGCGVPTVATRTLLKKLHNKYYDVPLVFLGDHNGGGVQICNTYMCGSMDMAYDSLNLCIPGIKWLGLSPSDLEEHDIPVGEEKVKRLDCIKNLNFVDGCPELAEEVAKMETKVDVEVMIKKTPQIFDRSIFATKIPTVGLRHIN